jgi:hypothetical protein
MVHSTSAPQARSVLRVAPAECAGTPNAKSCGGPTSAFVSSDGPVGFLKSRRNHRQPVNKFVGRAPATSEPTTRRKRRQRAAPAHANTNERPLLVNARPHYEKTYPLSSWRVEHPRPYKRLIPDIVVFPEMLTRALGVANALYLALEQRGFQVVLAEGYHHRPTLDCRDEPGRPIGPYERGGWSPNRPTIVFVETIAIGLTLYELTESVEVARVNEKYVRKDSLPPRRRRPERDWVHKEDMPSGRLGLRAYSTHHAAPCSKSGGKRPPLICFRK